MRNVEKILKLEQNIIINSPELLNKSRECLDNVIKILDDNHIVSDSKYIIGLAAHVYAMVERSQNHESVMDIDDELLNQVAEKYKQLAKMCIESFGKDFEIQNYKSELFLMAVHIQNLAEREEL